MNKLKAWRKDSGKTQGDLAAVLGVSRQSIVNYERDKGDARRRIPPHEILERLAEISGGKVTPNDFFDLPPPRSGGLCGAGPVEAQA